MTGNYNTLPIAAPNPHRAAVQPFGAIRQMGYSRALQRYGDDRQLQADKELVTLLAAGQVAGAQMHASLDLLADGALRAAGDPGASWIVAQQVAEFHDANLARFRGYYR
jgi:hypothetical protein